MNMSSSQGMCPAGRLGGPSSRASSVPAIPGLPSQTPGNNVSPVAATNGDAGSATLDMEAEALYCAGGATSLRLLNPSTKGQIVGDYLVLVPVRDLKVGDDIVDEHGPRRVTKIERYKSSAFITFSEGASNWYFDSELFPVEHLS